MNINDSKTDFKRKIEKDFIDWKNSLHSKKRALLVKGLRQVGKTTAIKNFTEKNFKHVVFIDFIKQPNLKNIFNKDSNVDRIVKELEIIDPLEYIFQPFETVLVFDEIQECAAARKSIKNFMEDGRYDIICSGSLLGIRGYNHKSEDIPVGFEYSVQMFALDFEEFLWAKGYKEEFTKEFKNNFLTLTPFSETTYDKLSELFREYICVGGMPFIVKRYIETDSFVIARKEQKLLLESFKDDFGSHLNENEEKVINTTFLANILKVNESIPTQLSKENKKFMYSQLEHKGRGKKYDPAIQFLEDYGLIKKCYNLSTIQIPLNGNKLEQVFKIYVQDTGLFLAMLDEGSASSIIQNKFEIYKGAIYENIVADALIKNNIPLYYFHKDSGLEIDFVVNFKQEPVIIEAKAVNGNTKSAKTILNNKNNKVNKCYKLGDFNISDNGSIKNIPHFCAYLITEE